MALSSAARSTLTSVIPGPVQNEIIDILANASVLSGDEAAFIDGVVAGVRTASKALVAGASGEIDALTVTALLTNAFTFPLVARTATAAGATTGTIADAGYLQVVTVTCDDANKIILLPAPAPGTIVILQNGTTGYELRSSDCATVGINGGVDTAAESAIPASTTAVLICETATNWKGFQMSSTAGTLAAVQVAAN